MEFGVEGLKLGGGYSAYSWDLVGSGLDMGTDLLSYAGNRVCLCRGVHMCANALGSQTLWILDLEFQAVIFGPSWIQGMGS